MKQNTELLALFQITCAVADLDHIKISCIADLREKALSDFTDKPVYCLILHDTDGAAAEAGAGHAGTDDAVDIPCLLH